MLTKLFFQRNSAHGPLKEVCECIWKIFPSLGFECLPELKIGIWGFLMFFFSFIIYTLKICRAKNGSNDSISAHLRSFRLIWAFWFWADFGSAELFFAQNELASAQNIVSGPKSAHWTVFGSADFYSINVILMTQKPIVVDELSTQKMKLMKELSKIYKYNWNK